MTVKAVWHIVKESATRIGVAKLAPHDLRRTCARLCHASRGVGADPISFGARFGANDRTLPWLQTADSIQPSMIALASRRILELALSCGRVADDTF